MPMETLPTEVCQLVLHRLCGRDLLELASVSKQFQEIVSPWLDFHYLAPRFKTRWTLPKRFSGAAVPRISEDGRVVAVLDVLRFHCAAVNSEDGYYALHWMEVPRAHVDISVLPTLDQAPVMMLSSRGNLAVICDYKQTILVHRPSTGKPVVTIPRGYDKRLFGRDIGTISKSEEFICITTGLGTQCCVEIYSATGRLLRSIMPRLCCRFNVYIAGFGAGDRLVVVDRAGYLLVYAAPHFSDSTCQRIRCDSVPGAAAGTVPSADFRTVLRISAQDCMFLYSMTESGRLVAVSEPLGLMCREQRLRWRTTFYVGSALCQHNMWSSGVDQTGHPFVIEGGHIRHGTEPKLLMHRDDIVIDLLQGVLSPGGDRIELDIRQPICSGTWIIYMQGNDGGQSMQEQNSACKGFQVTVTNIVPFFEEEYGRLHSRTVT